jgi:LysM repeat protein
MTRFRFALLFCLFWLILPVYAQSAPADIQSTHTVQPGENLFRIALRYGVSMDDIAAANDITNQARIFSGQELVIPGLEAPDSGDEVNNPLIAAPPVIHTVRRGEYLSQIADLYDVSLESIMQANDITVASRIYPGQELQIWTEDISANLNTDAPAAPVPLESDTESDTETADSTLADESAGSTTDNTAILSTPTPDDTETVTHTVRPGEHLSQIGRLYGVNWTVIAEANGIYNANSIYAGQRLTIPGGDTSVAETVSNATTSESNFSRTAAEEAPGAYVGEGRELVVDLSSQMAYAYEDGVLKKSSLVSTGLPATPTVQGNYNIWHKTPMQDMSGPGYYISNVRWVMYFYKGYGFHGTHWHENFGQPMSRGCVNMTNEDARWFYEFASLGTPVHVRY